MVWPAHESRQAVHAAWLAFVLPVQLCRPHRLQERPFKGEVALLMDIIGQAVRDLTPGALLQVGRGGVSSRV